MKLKIFNLPAFLLIALLAVSSSNFAQQAPLAPPAPINNVQQPVEVVALRTEEHQINDQMAKISVDLADVALSLQGLGKEQAIAMKNLSVKLKAKLSRLNKNLNLDIDKMMPDINLDVQGIGANISTGTTDINSTGQDGQAPEKEKIYSKTYSVGANDRLQIDNHYGNITVNTWNRDEVKVEVHIKAQSNSDAATQKLLDDVQINDIKSNDLISFVTKINNSVNGLMGDWSGRKVRKLEINYTVYMPLKTALQINNRYGSTQLPDLDGKVVLDNAYGSLSAKSLNNAANQIRVEYGSAVIENLTSSDVHVAYGNLQVGTVNRLNANVSYGSAKIGRIRVSGTISIKYGSPLVITDVDKTLENLSVNCAYSGVKLGLSGDENADFDVTVKNGSFDYTNGVSITSKTPPDNAKGWSPTKNYKGRVGKGNAARVINITSSFGSVKFE